MAIDSGAIEQKKSATLTSAFDSLLAATDAFKNLRAILLLGTTFILTAVLFGVIGFLTANTGSMIIGGIGSLLVFLVVFYGLNAVGILIMREVQGNGIPTIAEAIFLSLSSAHRLLGVVLIEGLIVLALVIAAAIILFVCKIPVLGPILFAFVFPAAAIILGMCIFSLFFVMLPLAGPAVWSGSTLLQVVARLNTIARSKLVPVVLLQIILFFIVSLTAMLIFSVVMTGSTITTGLSASILDIGSFGFDLFQLYGAGSGYLIASGIGGGLLFAFASVVPSVMYTKGVCIIYTRNTADLNFAAAEAQLASGIASARKRAEEVRERTLQLATEPATASAPVQAPAQPACPSCRHPVAVDDVFCGNCAHKLK